jgi:hypothetical protein
MLNKIKQIIQPYYYLNKYIRFYAHKMFDAKVPRAETIP